VPGVKAVVFGDQTRFLAGRKFTLHEIEVKIFVFSINLIADDRVADVAEMDSYLVFAASEEDNANQRKAIVAANEIFQSKNLGHSRQTGGCHTVLNGDTRFGVRPERRVHNPQPKKFAVGNCEILFVDGAGFPKHSQMESRLPVFRDYHDSAGFPVKPIDQVSLGVPQIKADATDQAGINVAFGRMADQARRFIDDQKVVVFGDDVEEMFH
jgi:hypothetical protein